MIRAKGGAKCDAVKRGMEAIKNFTLSGMVAPMEATPEDHEGGGWVQVWSVKDGDWFQAHYDVIRKHLASVH